MDGGMEGGKEGWMEGYYLIPFICDPKVVKLQTAVVRSWGGGGLPPDGCEVPVL